MSKKENTQSNEPAATGHVPFATKVFYANGAFSECLLFNCVLILATPIYSIGLGVSATAVGTAIGIPIMWNAVISLFVGNLSDNTRCRFGRRRPYILVFSILAGILFALLWMPPTALGPRGLFVYFLALTFIHFTAFTLFSIPYNSLGFELTSDYHERTRLMAFKTFLMYVATFATAFIYKLCFVFGHGNEVRGVRYVGILFGLIMLLTGIQPALFCREKIEIQAQASIRLLTAIKETLANRTFLVLVTVALITTMALSICTPFGMYLGISYVFRGNREAMSNLQIWAAINYAVSGMLGTTLMAWIGTHLGKKRTFMLGLAVGIVGFLSTWVMITPRNPWLGLIPGTFMAVGFAGFMTVFGSMMADICDLDELHCGLRREGMYSAVAAFILRLGHGATMILGGYLVDLTGLNLDLDVQSDQTTLRMRLIYLLTPVLMLSASILIARYYSITEKQFLKVRSILDRRKLRQQNQNNPERAETTP